MIKLSPEALVKIRDRLREQGARPSLVIPNIKAPIDVVEAMQVVEEYGPLCDAMFLMMSADGKVAESEREVLKGALRELDTRIRSSHIESMLDAASRRLAADGREKRIRDVAEALSEDPVRGEIAFLLAAAVAFADDEIADEENEMLNDFAEALGIDEAHADALLDDLDT
jgi:uncharacterized tellurite resistance protein B-like protein